MGLQLLDTTSGDTRGVTLTFLRDELLYDIRNYAYVEGDVMPEGGEHNRHQTIDIGESGNVDRVTRLLDLVHQECVNMLYPFTKANVDDEETRSDVLEETPTYVISMSVPSDFSKTTADYLEKLIHEFMVYRVLADWLSITNPNAGERWRLRAEDALSKLKEVRNMAYGKARLRTRPF